MDANKSARTVYFPQTNWYDFYTGSLYLGGSNVSIVNKPNELVPLFLREGFGLMIQNSTLVTQTRQLDNKFTLMAAMNKDSASNATDKIYTSSAYTLSIGNYEDKVNFQFIF